MKTTSLFEWHRAHGATMGEFGGYSMPLWYPTGARQEHLAVLTAAGIFDTGHMSVIVISGPDALPFLQYCCTKDLTRVGAKKLPLDHCKCTNGAFLDERGWVVDDCVVYFFEHDRYMIAVNAGMGEIIAPHIEKHIGGYDVQVTLIDEEVDKIDLQGPSSGRILAACLVGPDRFFDGMGFYRFKGCLSSGMIKCDRCGDVHFKNGATALVSRSGYTGEFGFEIFVSPDEASGLWKLLIDAGTADGLLPCGLAARDSLRAGAVLPLSHQDIGEWPFLNNPWLYALPFNDDRTEFTKDFVGREALETTDYSEHTLPFAGFDPRKVDIHGDGAGVFDSKGKRIGRVLTCATDVGIGRIDGRIVGIASPDVPDGFSPRGLSCGFVRVERLLDYGEVVMLRDARREIRVEIVRNVRPGRTSRRPLREMIGGG